MEQFISLFVVVLLLFLAARLQPGGAIVRHTVSIPRDIVPTNLQMEIVRAVMMATGQSAASDPVGFD